MLWTEKLGPVGGEWCLSQPVVRPIPPPLTPADSSKPGAWKWLPSSDSPKGDSGLPHPQLHRRHERAMEARAQGRFYAPSLTQHHNLTGLGEGAGPRNPSRRQPTPPHAPGSGEVGVGRSSRRAHVPLPRGPGHPSSSQPEAASRSPPQAPPRPLQPDLRRRAAAGASCPSSCCSLGPGRRAPPLPALRAGPRSRRGLRGPHSSMCLSGQRRDGGGVG